MKKIFSNELIDVLETVFWIVFGLTTILLTLNLFNFDFKGTPIKLVYIVLGYVIAAIIMCLLIWNKLNMLENEIKQLKQKSK